MVENMQTSASGKSKFQEYSDFVATLRWSFIAKIVNGFYPFFAKSSILDAWKDFECSFPKTYTFFAVVKMSNLRLISYLYDYSFKIK